MESTTDRETEEELLQKLKEYDFKFENLAFEGGGVKGVGHIGMIQVLGELGLMQNMKRFAGTSVGSMIAAMAAVGCTPEEMMEAFGIDIGNYMLDAAFGVLAFLPNLIKRYGWNPGEKLHGHVEKVISRRSGIDMITFKQVYDNYGHELCVTATNVSTMTPEYFHPKTTPDMPITLAVKCSTALPGYLQPVSVDFPGGMSNLMTDGGLSCAFPVFVFDGWYLSMDPKDSFFKRMDKKADDRFATFNAKTLGGLLIAATDNENNLGELISRTRQPVRPDTRLARLNGKMTQEAFELISHNQNLFQAARHLFSSFQKADGNDDAQISLEEFKEAISKISKEESELLFGTEEYDVEKVFEEIDRNGDKMIQDSDFFHFMQQKGLRYQALAMGGTMQSVNTLGDYLGSIVQIAINMSVVINRKDNDILRTVGINTDYVGTTDWDVDPVDKQFMCDQGRAATLDHLAWLLEKKRRGELPKEYDAVIIKRA